MRYSASMSTREQTYPDDVEALQALLRKRDATIAALTMRVNQLLAKRFGASSEQVPSSQLGLFNEAEELDAEEADNPECEVTVPSHTRRRRGKRSPLPSWFEREERVYDLDEAEKTCPHDGARLEPIGEETLEQFDIVPMTMHVVVHRRLTYACPCCHETVRTAKGVAHPIPKSQASPGLLAYVAVSKFCDALPLYRQSKQFARIGVDFPRQTLARWMIRSGELVQPLVNLLRDELLSQSYIQCDETTVQVLKEPGKSAQSHSYIWVQRSGETDRPVVLFDYDPSRSGEVPKRLLGDFNGYLQTDGYRGYDAVVTQNAMTHVYCFAHARRRFTDVLRSLGLNPKKLPAKPPPKARRAMRAVQLIGTLYEIERRIRGRKPEERYAVRQTETRAALDRLKAWADEVRDKVPPKTPLGEALTYLHTHWVGLTRFCDDGRLEVDNNACENAIRPFVVGRKNFLFSDTIKGATSSANLYSLIETAKANGLEPYAYLRKVFAELPRATTVEDIEALLPFPSAD